MTEKSLDDYFADWEGSIFGYGYGSGEPHIIPAVHKFLSMRKGGGTGRSYDYAVLEAELGPTVAWLLINVMCHARMIDYGSSPRFGWLSTGGEALRDYVATKTTEQLLEIATRVDQDYVPCYPDACNCGPNGHLPGVKCSNPFWQA